MSIMKCDECERFIDTDYFPMEIEETKYGDRNYCDSCAEKLSEERDRQEHLADINQQEQEKRL